MAECKFCGDNASTHNGRTPVDLAPEHRCDPRKVRARAIRECVKVIDSNNYYVSNELLRREMLSIIEHERLED
jgi:hypothetical protein